jgi:dienelactone hydrolase
MRTPPRRALLALLGLIACLPTARAALVTSVFDGRLPCTVHASGVQFCQGSLATRVETWDGIPIDVNVTLPPASVAGAFPLIVELHGWSLGKTDAPFVDRARDGYVVMSASARGFHQSCGVAGARLPDPSLSDPDACAERGWTHLADARFEARDTQFLAGMLADEGLVVPDKVGVTGASYGGGRAILLAQLRDRTMLEDGSLVPWQSPGGLDMAIAAGAALIPWSDLAYALAPNGSLLDFRALNPYTAARPGVAKLQWVSTLFVAGTLTGHYAPQGADPSADLIGWNQRLAEGEPYDDDPFVKAMIAELTANHSPYGIDDSQPPAPLFIYNAWTDDLFPAGEGLRFALKTKARHPDAEIALLFGDGFGHPRAGLGNIAALPVNARVEDFFARHLQGDGAALPGVEVYTQGCGGSAVMGPILADDWQALHPGEVRLQDAAPRTFDEAGGDPATAAALAPLAGGPCRVRDELTDPGAATWVLPAATGGGYTLLGSPTVSAHYVTTNAPVAQVFARLWDVGPDGTQAFITWGVYRPRLDDAGPQTFQLHPNGWHFAPGHAAKLELLGQSVPLGQASSGPFTVTVRDLDLRLPVREAPNGGAVTAPADLAYPPVHCPPDPRGQCGSPGKSRLLVSRAKNGRERLTWSWRGDDAATTDDFAAAITAGGYALCVYDAAGLRSTNAAALGTGACGKRACWKIAKKTARYRDKALARGAVKSLVLRGASKQTKIAAQATGERLAVPALPAGPLPLTVQLVDAGGACRGATFSAAKKNDERRLKAKAD